MNKKAFLTSAIIDYFAYLAFALVIVTFFFVFNHASKNIEAQVTELKVDIENGQYLVTLLNKPITINNHDYTIAELIVNSFYDNTNNLLLKQEAIKILKSIPPPQETTGGWNLDIFFMPQEKLFWSIPSFTSTQTIKIKSHHNYVILPLREPKAYLKLDLNFETHKPYELIRTIT